MSSSDSDRSQHQLSYYGKDKVKLMKETLKIIKPKRIKAMAPDCIKHLNIGEINSILLEELLGISNKRLTYIFNGEDVDRETSSSDSEDGKIDIISLDDISDDDNLEFVAASSKQSTSESVESFKKNKTIKRKLEESGTIKVKKEKTKKNTSNDTKKVVDKESEKSKLMSVLELLELQARARAIRSQLALEDEDSKNNEVSRKTEAVKQEGSDSDAVIINNPSDDEIVITSESDTEHDKTKSVSTTKTPATEASEVVSNCKDIESQIKQRKEIFLAKLQKIKLVRQKQSSDDHAHNVCKKNASNECSLSFPQNQIEPNSNVDTNSLLEDCPSTTIYIKSTSDKDMICDNDEIVINLDDDEMKSIDHV